MVLSRAREKGLEADELVALGEQEQVPAYVAAGLFLRSYLDNLDDQSATDYADLIRRAVIEATAHRAELRRQFRHVFVDEYQDTDPGQVALLRALAGDGGDLVVVGDPHQSIYGFRGAEVRGILEFPADFPRPDGTPAPVVPLRTTRRFGPRLLVATQRVAGRIGLPGAIDVEARESFLHPVAAETTDDGPGAGADLRHRARRGRAPRRPAPPSPPRGRRPVGPDGRPGALRPGQHPAAASRPRRGRRPGRGGPRRPAAGPGPVGAAAARGAAGRGQHRQRRRRVRRLRRPQPRRVAAARAARRPRRGRRTPPRAAAARPREGRRARRRAPAAHVQGAGPAGGAPRRLPRRDPGPEATAARALHTLVRATSDGLAEGGTAEDALWALWSGTDWPGRLRRSVELGGGAARRAHRDLDSVVALFDVAAREAEKRDVAAVSGAAGVRDFLSRLGAQQIPADTLAEQGVRGSAVRLLTAHRSKGLEWDLVVVAHVQQEGWPDLRRRSTLLQADRIGTDGHGGASSSRRPPPASCCRRNAASSTSPARAPVRGWSSPPSPPPRTTATSRPASSPSSASPSRRSRAGPTGRCPSRAWSASCGAPSPTPARRRRCAPRPRAGWPAWPARRSTTGPWSRRPTRRRGGAPGPRPGRCVPVRDPEQPVPVSASMLEAVMVCPTRWFLTTEAGGAGSAHQSANIGQLVHALAQRVAVGEVPPDLDLLLHHVDEVWGRLHFRTPWSAAREHERIEVALTRFLEWHAANPRKLIGTEEKFETVVELESGERVKLNGYADRLELDADGRVVVVDLKTTKDKPTGPQLQRHVQLGVYQYAVDHGAVDLLAPDGHGRERWRGARPPRPARRRRGRGPAAAGVRRRRRRAHHPAGADGAGVLPRAGRDLPGRRRRPLPRLRLQADLPDPGRGVGDVPMKISTPEELAALMRWDFAPSPEQWEAIRAPLEPAVVIAGAGSGKTTLMAARVVYLVATGQVRPDEVLGPDLHHQGRQPAARQGPRGAARGRPAARAGADSATTATTPSSRPWRRTTPMPPACSPTTACASATSPTPGCSRTRRATSSARGWWSGTRPRSGS